MGGAGMEGARAAGRLVPSGEARQVGPGASSG